MFRKFSPPCRSTLLCSNVVKFIRREIGEIVRYLPDQKTNFRLPLKLSLLRGSCPKPARASPQQSKCSRFHPNRRSYSRTRQHCFFYPVECFHDSPEAMLRFGRITNSAICWINLCLIKFLIQMIEQYNFILICSILHSVKGSCRT